MRTFLCSPVHLHGLSLLLGPALLTGCVEKTTEKQESLGKQATLVYNMGEADHPEASLDLDQGSVLDSPEADITLMMSKGIIFVVVLKPINGAKARPMGIENVSLDDCRQKLEDFSQGNIPEVTAGSQICVLTGRGRLALIQIDAASSPEPEVARLQVSYTVEPAPQSR